MKISSWHVYEFGLNCICVTFGFGCHVVCYATLLSCCVHCYVVVLCGSRGICVCTCESRVGGEGWISLFWARAPDSQAANKGGKRPGEGERLWVSIGTPSAKIWIWEGGRTRWRKTAGELCNWCLSTGWIGWTVMLPFKDGHCSEGQIVMWPRAHATCCFPLSTSSLS